MAALVIKMRALCSGKRLERVIFGRIGKINATPKHRRTKTMVKTLTSGLTNLVSETKVVKHADQLSIQKMLVMVSVGVGRWFFIFNPVS